MAAAVEVRRIMDGDPKRVYELIADVTRMGEWSPESAGADWRTGQPGTVGSTFRGDNRRPWMKWSTICTVIAADPGKRFAFTVQAAGRPVATWEFQIAPRADGCEVTERTLDQRGLLYKSMSVLSTGLMPRSVRNRRTMKQHCTRWRGPRRADVTGWAGRPAIRCAVARLRADPPGLDCHVHLQRWRI